jgi:crotonobetainyl-CoA:carnitine CoA-transferase CaiB-like acyl-CoA transferase
MDTALDGLRVLDFSRVLAGPLATMTLGDLGADVIKVERPGGGDETRSWGPPYDEAGRATYFLAANRNKRSVSLDLTDAADLELALRLAAEADVLVENFRPGVMERLGLGFDRLHADNPRLLYASITGFGAGPGAALPGYDLLVQALGGLMSITGAPEGEPQKVGVALVDVIAGLFATVGVLAALDHRNRSGEGQRIEIDLLSSLLAALANQGAAYTAAGEVAARMGNSHPSISPYSLYPAADGDLVVAVGNDRQFAGLCEVLGAPELTADPRFATNPARVTHSIELRAELVESLRGRAVAECVEALLEAGVPAGQVNDVEGAFRLAASLGLEPIVEVADKSGVSRLTANPIHLSQTPVSYRAGPPPLAERSPAARISWLG